MKDRPQPRWETPIIDGPTAVTAHAEGWVSLSMPSHSSKMTALEACQLGQALQDAARAAGQAGARRRR